MGTKIYLALDISSLDGNFLFFLSLVLDEAFEFSFTLGGWFFKRIFFPLVLCFRLVGRLLVDTFFGPFLLSSVLLFELDLPFSVGELFKPGFSCLILSFGLEACSTVSTGSEGEGMGFALLIFFNCNKS